jgi:hypothetical protein
MHGSINVKYPNNTSKWQMGFNSAFKGLREGNKFTVLENRMPSGVTGWRKLNNEGLQGQAKEKDMGKGTSSKR